MPRLTYLGPIYNKESWVGETIENLQLQSLEDIEILFIDDGSTDSTTKIIESYMKDDKRIRLHKIGKNVGLGKAWNIGTRLVRSPIIGVISGDDLWEKDRAKITVDYLDKNKNKDIFYGSFYFCSSNMNPKEYKPAVPFNKKKLLTPRKDGFSTQYLGHFVMSYRTSVALAVPYREDRKYGVDYPFVIDLAKAGYKFGWTNKCLGYARVLESGVSHVHREDIVKEDHKLEKSL